MNEKQKEKILHGLRKKDNLDYWNDIDFEVIEFLCKLAKYSYANVKCYYQQDYDDFDWEDYEDESELDVKEEIMWLADDVRDFVVERLEKEFGAWFPYVDEEY